MTKVDLSKLNSLSFEKMVRALAFSFFGPSGTVFSSGPDGGRDFTIEGKISGYEPRGWHGYLVLQAKFCEVPGDARVSLNWLLNELKGELKTFTDKASGARTPHYYILATNVSLSGADGLAAGGARRTGGYTKVSSAFDLWRSAIGLKDFDIWPADKIVDLLAGAPDVRRTYAAWVTSGDVLACVLEKLDQDMPDFRTVLSSAMRKNLRRDQFTKLKDAGSVSDSQIRTGQVFIDLPATLQRTSPETNQAASPYNANVLASLVEIAKGRLSADFGTVEPKPAFSRSPRSRIVILGGPGQGKSTVSTFAVQLFRAAILADSPQAYRETTISESLDEILRCASSEMVPANFPLRYPVLVSLPAFADKISTARTTHSQVPSLLSHISSDLAAASDRQVARENLRRWLGEYPWLVVLDGLDEVPPAGERSAIIDAIEDFQSEILDADGDVLLIVTSRPQGYNHDLKPSLWEHWTLGDLPQERALTYASSLSKALYPYDPDRCDEITKSLQRASEQPATSHLMTTPLQVTILHLIVDGGGSVLPGRWAIFDQYFEVLRRRERGKGGTLQAVIERNWSHLKPLLQRAGLILHTESEGKGGANPSLNQGRFEALVREFMKAEGYDDSEVSKRSMELTNLALNRLVLLHSREEGSITFDIRSLQEYMAAGAITAGPPADTHARLFHIATAAHWQHVFLIAASRCFAEEAFHHLRSSIVSIPRDLETSIAQLAVKNGALLALDMFIDGIGSDHPISRRALAIHALELLKLGPWSRSSRILSVWEATTIGVIVPILQDYLANRESSASLAAWQFVLFVFAKEFEVPREYEVDLLEIAEKGVPQNVDQLAATLSENLSKIPRSVVVNMEKVFLANSPLALYSLARRSPTTTDRDDDVRKFSYLEKVGTVVDAFNPDKSKNIGMLNATQDAPLSFRIRSVTDTWLLHAKIGGTHPGWTLASKAAAFVESPSPATLAMFLNAAGTDDATYQVAKGLTWILPWPMATVLNSSKSKDDILSLSEEAAGGAFGGHSDWEKAEARWLERGITWDDLAFWKEKGFRFGRDVAEIGLPHSHAWQVHVSAGPVCREIVLGLAAWAHALDDNDVKQEMAFFIQFGLAGLGPAARIEHEEDASRVLSLILEHKDRFLELGNLGAFSDHLWEQASFLDAISGVAPRCEFRDVRPGRTIRGDLILAGYLAAPRARRGLLVLLVYWIAFGRDVNAGILASLNVDELEPVEEDSQLLRVSCLLLAAIRGRLQPDLFARTLAEASDLSAVNLAGHVFSTELVSASDREVLCEALAPKVIARRIEETSAARTLLKTDLDRRSALLFLRENWFRLNLPEDAYSVLRIMP